MKKLPNEESIENRLGLLAYQLKSRLSEWDAAFFTASNPKEIAQMLSESGSSVVPMKAILDYINDFSFRENHAGQVLTAEEARIAYADFATSLSPSGLRYMHFEGELMKHCSEFDRHEFDLFIERIRALKGAPVLES